MDVKQNFGKFVSLEIESPRVVVGACDHWSVDWATRSWLQKGHFILTLEVSDPWLFPPDLLATGAKCSGVKLTLGTLVDGAPQNLVLSIPQMLQVANPMASIIPPVRVVLEAISESPEAIWLTVEHCTSHCTEASGHEL